MKSIDSMFPRRSRTVTLTAVTLSAALAFNGCNKPQPRLTDVEKKDEQYVAGSGSANQSYGATNSTYSPQHTVWVHTTSPTSYAAPRTESGFTNSPKPQVTTPASSYSSHSTSPSPAKATGASYGGFGSTASGHSAGG
jgi:hypothetical protein